MPKKEAVSATRSGWSRIEAMSPNEGSHANLVG
jgi:hypothetical protein